LYIEKVNRFVHEEGMLSKNLLEQAIIEKQRIVHLVTGQMLEFKLILEATGSHCSFLRKELI
jgi:hypothetical protein